MSESAEIHARLDDLEEEVAEVRFLASKADKDVSELRGVLTGHTGVLNALRETQLEQGKLLATQGRRIDRLERKFDEGFTRLNLGQGQIITLLNIAIGRRDDET